MIVCYDRHCSVCTSRGPGEDIGFWNEAGGGPGNC